jgi:hypothetical protein
LKIGVAIRGFANGTKLFEERVWVGLDEIDALATKHALALCAYRRHMIEVEFLDEPDPLQRFFRIGTDPSGMVRPMQVNLKSRSRAN